MISVIVYGRNDSHGYNLARRAALSINCIASVLGAPGDEILFVDYNSPDVLPTFPQSISDTLTARARALLRIIRVRPSFHHDLYACKTSLPVLEPVARNIALRRSRPENAWILSTNTDMIFATDGMAMGALAEKLSPGLYHAPRFELPEILWESLDRRDPDAALRAVSEWGRAFRLEETVRAGPDAVFDGPGDFQLFPRAAGFEIGGFEEAMIHGWHVDANFGRRMRMKYGAISEAPSRLRGFHCGHTRESTRYHSADAAQNDERRFVSEVVKTQSASGNAWGAPGFCFEELRLEQHDAPGALLKALGTHVAAPLPERRLVAETHGDLDYDAGHVLPHLLNVTAFESPDARICYVGCRADMRSLFAAAWSALPGERCAIAEAVDGDEVARSAAIDGADLFIFEFGVECDDDAAAGQALGRVMGFFEKAIAAERARLATGSLPRRFILVNAAHNEIEAAARATLATTLSPYSTRVRSGFVRASDASTGSITSNRDGGPAPRWSGKIAGFDEDAPLRSRAVRAEDWERPHWRGVVRRYLPLVSLEPASRSDSLWEAASMLEAAADVLSRPDARALLIAPKADLLAGALSNAARLDVMDLSAGSEPWRTRLAVNGSHAPQDVRLVTAPAVPDCEAYDAVFLPAETMRVFGRFRAPVFLEAASKAARDGSLVVFGAYARFARLTGRSTLPAGMLRPDGLAKALVRYASLAPVGEVDFRLTNATLNLIGDKESRPSVGAPLVLSRRGAVLAKVLFALVKRRGAGFRRLPLQAYMAFGI